MRFRNLAGSGGLEGGRRLRSIVLANQKGGVGKTTTAIHLAHGLALTGARVALFDLDPQGNATVALQAMANETETSAPLTGLTRLATNLWLLPSPSPLANEGAAVPLAALKALVAELASVLDWLVVDNPPRMDDWGWAGVQLADQVLVPVQAEFFAMHGLSQMLQSLEVATGAFPGKAALLGVLPTMVDYREPITREILSDLAGNLGSRLLHTVILRDSHLIEAASFGRTVFDHCPFAKSSFCYADLVKELTHGGPSFG
ncbi:MAG: ParA family protein [Planctomycetota bacterium]